MYSAKMVVFYNKCDVFVAETVPKALPSGVSRLELLTSAVAEVLRFRSPVVTMPRVCREDRELGALLERGEYK